MMGWGCHLSLSRNDLNLFKLEHTLKVGDIKNKQKSLLEINYYCIYFIYAFGVYTKSLKKKKSSALQSFKHFYWYLYKNEKGCFPHD